MKKQSIHQQTNPTTISLLEGASKNQSMIKIKVKTSYIEVEIERTLITADNYQLTDIAKDIINKVTEDTIKIKNCYITQN